jgi:RNA polymerase sigma factor (sigma-70 family)
MRAKRGAATAPIAFMSSSEDDSAFHKRAIADFQAPLLRFARTLVAEHAGDVVQDTFERLLGEDRSKVQGHLRAWLFTVCRNRAIELRRRSNRVFLMAEDDEMMSHATGPEGAALEKENRRALRAMLDTLPERQREVVTLRFAGGLSYQEIAEVTKLSIGNVGFILHTALKTLRTRMSEGETAERRSA